MSSSKPTPQHSRPATRRKRGVVGIIFRDDRLLIIRRSKHVTAPGKLCLPGGGIEAGETEEQALVREMQEELALDVLPVRRCWRSVTPWGTNLAWWLATNPADKTPIPCPREVADIMWMTAREIETAKEMLPSLPDFMNALNAGSIDLQWGHSV